FVIVSHNPNLTNIDGLAGLPGTHGQVRIENNSKLEHLDGLGNMKGIGGNFGLLGNPALVDSSGLVGIQAVAGDILVSNNPQVNYLSFNSLETIDGSLAITDMVELDSLDDLYGL